MDLWQSLAGMIVADLTSANPEEALAAINLRGIQIWDIQTRGDLTVRLRVFRKDFKRLLELTSRRGEGLKIIRRQGLYWTGKKLLRRPVLTAGAVILLAMILMVPTRVLFVQVEGNDTIPERRILEAARFSGIHFGASRRKVRSEKVKNHLMAQLPELQWAGVNTQGCVAVISVRERCEVVEEGENPGISSIVAARDGIILSCTATKGSLLCAVGQAVQAGDVLISGFTDCGLTVTATRADGEIIALTRRCLTVCTPFEYQIRGEKTAESTKYSLVVGKKRINLYKGSGIWDATCGKMYKEYHLTLPGGFRLPVTLVKETVAAYEMYPQQADENETQKQLTSFASAYLRRLMVAGTVLSGENAFEKEADLFRLTGEFSCTEMIGKVRDEQIGE